ncbi:MAG: NADH-quinone oxidoreductase subunit G [Xanthomonadales bacterium]|nr:NADH-quinone oxidoreductase subunit NuoG [Gammaproteobacteria bacterium]NNK52635.1 NADH-quinone oxidoreductase subunit G [Xanthomonadales bacterium]
MSAEIEQAVEQAVDMVNIEVNGIPLEAPKGSMIIEATDKAGIEIPRFCYHPKLSIAANCRMCLVDVEKMPKPVPACATPVMEGMKVYTESRRAMDAQHGVMEFLLINHPLDCPICDQGGECELQDQAMGYGRSVSRFTERKRVVKDKDVGPLVQTEMTRCIHCTRCVRFLEEIAGTSEMGGAGRGDRLEIGTCVQNSINSELSGNVIDICPVGALTNKPFRFQARAWELMARPSLAAHDGVGSCLFHHVRRGEILRTVPRENEATNESWLSDRDRYSHIGLYSDDRVTAPEIKQNGEWKSVSWDEAAATVARILRDAIETHGAEQVGMLMSPSASTEEYFLAQRLLRRSGCNNIDHRLRQQDFTDDAAPVTGAPFAKKIAGIERSDAILLVGSNPREEAPLIGHRVRQAWRKGAKISLVNPLNWEFTFDTSLDAIVAPQFMVSELAALAAAVEKSSGVSAPGFLRSVLDGAAGQERHEALAGRLQQASGGLVLLGQFALMHPDAAWLRALSAYVAEATGSALNTLSHGGNAAGARLAGALPNRGPGGSEAAAGLNVSQMLEDPRKCYVLWGIEPEYDIDNPARVMSALQKAESVISVVSHATDSLREISSVILPLAPLAESEGSLVNLDGAGMNFKAAGKAPGDARPGWKILRRLGGEMGLEGFQQVRIDDVMADMQSEVESADTPDGGVTLQAPAYQEGLYRIGELPMYSIDPLCRRSEPLQQTEQANNMFLGLNPEDAGRIGLDDGAMARVRQGDHSAELEVKVTARVPPGGAWLRSATCSTRELGPAVAPLTVEVA